MSHDLLLNMKIVLAINFKMPIIVTTLTIVGILKLMTRQMPFSTVMSEQNLFVFFHIYENYKFMLK